MIQINHVSCERRGQLILGDIHCDIEKHKITALIGPNGSGKSTLLKLISGVLPTSKGDISLEGKVLSHWSSNALAKKMAVLPQHNQVPVGLTVEQLVAMGRFPHLGLLGRLQPHDKERVSWALEQCQLQPWRHRRVDQLSGGEVQRCWLAMVLAQDTEYLLLDEPTSFLDIGHQVALLDIVHRLNREWGKTIVWVLHDINQASLYSDNMLLLEKGHLQASGTPTQVLTPALASRVYQVPLTEVNVEQQRLLWPKLQRPEQ